MSLCSRASAVVAAALAAAPAALVAQAPGVHETQVWAVAAASRPALYAAGVGLAWRDDQRLRIAPALAAGVFGDGRFGARADLAIHFLLNPWKTAGPAVYGGGGLSLAMGDGRTAPYALLVLGVENAPGGDGGSFLEIGVGGGVRFALGYRWRTRNAPGR